jgi:MFS family permease
MLAEWAIALALVIVRGAKPTDKRRWTPIHTCATMVSLVCLLTAMAGLLPPDQLRGRSFAAAFYGTIVVLSIAVLAAVAARRPRVAALIFPALAVAAVSIAPLAGGIIFGFFAWLTLATHVLLLVPSLREQALAADSAV